MTKKTVSLIAGALVLVLVAGGVAYWATNREPAYKELGGPEEVIDPTPGVSFDTVKIADVTGPSVVALGPDGALYATSTSGQIMKYPLGADGRPSGEPRAIETFTGKRLLMGLAFDPKSTPENPILWVSGGQLCLENCTNFTGVVSVLSGPDLSNSRDVITGLPRSVTDHMTNGIAFGPDDKLYIAQGAQTAYGAPDATWGFRDETTMSASILQADVHGDARFQKPVDTSKGYVPTAADAAVKVYATGTRNPFDLLWHSNGSLYVPVNESSEGDAPAGPGDNPPGIKGNPSGDDFLARVQQGRYYGHPNPARNEFVLNGGNPTAQKDPYEVERYPVGVKPDPRYDFPILDLGVHRSANGIAEYKSDLFGGALQGQLLITEFEKGNDVIAVKLDANGGAAAKTQVAKNLRNPLDVVSDAKSGRIYVAEYGTRPYGEGGKITLLEPRV